MSMTHLQKHLQMSNKVVKNAERSYKKLLRSDLPKKGTLSFSSSVSEVARSAKLIIEAVPERLSAKQSVYDEIESSSNSEVYYCLINLWNSAFRFTSSDVTS